MSDERGDAPKDEGAEIARTDGQAESAEPDRAAEKEKRVPTYFFPNFLLVAAMTVFCGPAALIWAPLSFAGACFAMSASIDKSDRNYEKAARNARVARILFWTNFIGLAAMLLLGNYGLL